VQLALRRVAAVLASTVMGAALLAAPATASETGLSGVVTDESGAPISACVYAYSLDYEYAGSACTVEDGSWEIPDLAGTYRVRVDNYDGGYIGEWAQDAKEFYDAVDVTAPGSVDVALATAGVLTGTLTDGDGAPVPYASVSAHEASSEWAEVEYGSTDENGLWRLAVRPGDYKVQMSNWPADLWAFGATSFATATTLQVAAGATVQVDDHFPKAAKVTGRITEAKTKRPVAGACATLLPLTGYDSGDSFGSGCADETGAYSFNAYAEGSFLLLFNDPTGRFAAEYAGGATTLKQAKAVKVAAGRTTTASASLDIGAVLTGRVVDAASGAGIADVCPTAHAARSWDWLPGQAVTCTGEDGTYRLGGLAASPMSMLLTPGWQSGLSQTWYLGASDPATSTVLKPKVGRVTTLQDTRLARAGSVSGRVTDGLGDPVAGVYVNLDGRHGGRSGGCESQVCGQTDENGNYTVQAPPGTYQPIFYSYDGGWAPEWSGDASTKASATPITVTSGEDTSLDAELAQGGHISGTVVTAAGDTPSLYVAGAIFTETGDYIGDFDAYDGNGWTFTGSPLPAGNFRISGDLYDGTSGSSTRVWYDGSLTEAGATLVPLSLGETTDITFHLP
jgi:protocatechuate 3,4-dioxygenase beta subunit